MYIKRKNGWMDESLTVFVSLTFKTKVHIHGPENKNRLARYNYLTNYINKTFSSMHDYTPNSPYIFHQFVKLLIFYALAAGHFLP